VRNRYERPSRAGTESIRRDGRAQTIENSKLGISLAFYRVNEILGKSLELRQRSTEGKKVSKE
jgi:hypothetical protein